MAEDAASEAMRRYAAGDEQAFDDLYELVAPRLYRFLLRRARDGDEAEDLLQQTLLVVHRARSRYDRGAAVMPWLFAIARRLLIDHVRKARRDPLAAEPRSVHDVPSRAVRVDELIQAQQLVRRVEAALVELPAPKRLGFELLQRRGLSLRETAAALQITVGAVKLRMHRAQRSLRAALAQRAGASANAASQSASQAARGPRPCARSRR